MFRVLVTKKIPEKGLRLMEEAGLKVSVWPYTRAMSREELLEAVADKDAVVTMINDVVDEEFLEAAPNLKVIANYSKQYNNFHLWLATERKVVLTHTPEVATNAKAELEIGLILALARHVSLAHQYVRDGLYKHWEPLLFRGMELRGKTLGIFGMSAVARRLTEIAVFGFGLNVIYYDEDKVALSHVKAEQVTKEDILKHAHVISMHLPSIPSTRNFISTKEFVAMRDKVLFINTATGGTVDEPALVQALRGGKIGGAALDVFNCDVVGCCDPKDHTALKKHHNVILTPQIATSTHEARDLMSEMVANDVIAVSKGKRPTYVVNTELYE